MFDNENDIYVGCMYGSVSENGEKHLFGSTLIPTTMEAGSMEEVRQLIEKCLIPTYLVSVGIIRKGSQDIELLGLFKTLFG